MQNDSIQLNDEDLENINGGDGISLQNYWAAREIIDICGQIGNKQPTPEQICNLTQLSHQLDPSATDGTTKIAIQYLKKYNIM